MTSREIATNTSKLCTLPSTKEVFEESVEQPLPAFISKGAMHGPPSFDINEYGWIKEVIIAHQIIRTNHTAPRNITCNGV